MLIDSIGLDELRIIEPQSQTHFSKEFIRQFYRKTPWYKEVNEAKAQVGMNWKKLVLEKYGQPPRLVEPFLSTAENLYLTLVNTLTGQELSKNIMSISQLTEELKKCLKF
jgi:phosphoribosylaminoimidazole-succinocarboxamide synthase